MEFDYFAFHQKVERFYLECFSALRREYGITQAEIELLLHLMQYQQEDTATCFIQKYGLAKSQVSKSVERLAQKGLLFRRREPKNRRVIHLCLSTAGAELTHQICGRQASFLPELLENFAASERAQLFNALEKIQLRLSSMPQNR